MSIDFHFLQPGKNIVYTILAYSTKCCFFVKVQSHTLYSKIFLYVQIKFLTIIHLVYKIVYNIVCNDEYYNIIFN